MDDSIESEINKLESVNINYSKEYSRVEAILDSFNINQNNRKSILYKIRNTLVSILQDYCDYCCNVIPQVRQSIEAIRESELYKSNPDRWIDVIINMEDYCKRVDDYIFATNKLARIHRIQTCDDYMELCQIYTFMINTIESNYYILRKYIIELRWLNEPC